MAEYINKADIETVYCFKSCEECRNEMCPSELFGGLPAIEIVHCENCIHWEQSPTGAEGKCWRSPRHYSNHDDFCSYGAEPLHSERKDK